MSPLLLLSARQCVRRRALDESKRSIVEESHDQVHREVVRGPARRRLDARVDDVRGSRRGEERRDESQPHQDRQAARQGRGQAYHEQACREEVRARRVERALDWSLRLRCLLPEGFGSESKAMGVRRIIDTTRPK